MSQCFCSPFLLADKVTGYFCTMKTVTTQLGTNKLRPLHPSSHFPSLLDLNPNITWNTVGGHEEWDDDDENTGDEEDDTQADDDTSTSLLLDLGSR